jgi:Na+-transporting NADH:ubiquinone oxidoreductase subunit NqrF
MTIYDFLIGIAILAFIFGVLLFVIILSILYVLSNDDMKIELNDKKEEKTEVTNE